MSDEHRLPSAEDLDAVCAEREMAARAGDQAETSAPTEETITEDWLRETGFRWHQIERQTAKQWLLWLGDVTGTRDDGKRRMFSCYEDLGIQVSATWLYENGFPVGIEHWSCFVRADYAGRYSRFLFIRYVRTRGELISLCEGLTGQAWNPLNHFAGCMLPPGQAKLRRESDRRLEERLDRKILRQRSWNEMEKDDSRGRALPEHMQGAIDGGKAK